MKARGLLSSLFSVFRCFWMAALSAGGLVCWDSGGRTAIVAAYVEEYIWVVLLVSSCLWSITYYWEKLRHKGL